MANSVRFILINGASGEYIGNAPGTEYDLKLQEALLIPGAVIFGSYIKEAGSNIVYYELWANGKQYKFGGEGTVMLYESTEEPESYFGPGKAGSNTEIVPGTYYIKNKSIGNGQVEKTAYVYAPTTGQSKTTKAAWHAFTGNVDASNVFFSLDITLAGNYTQVGNVTKESVNSTETLEVTGTSLKTLMDTIFTKEEFPTPNYTYATLTASVDLPLPTIKSSDGSIVYAGGTNNIINYIVPVGTTCKLLSVLAVAPTYGGETSTVISNLINGYSENNVENSTPIKKINEEIQTSITASRPTPTLISTDNYQLDFSVSGFSSPSYIIAANPDQIKSTILADVKSNEKSLTVAEGKNNITVTETAKGFEATVPAINSYFIISNLGNTNSNKITNQIAQNHLTTERPTNEKSVAVYGAYPVITNGKAATSSDTNESASAAFNSVDGETLIALNPNSTHSPNGNNVQYKTFYVGFGDMGTHNWEIYLPDNINGNTFIGVGYNPLGGFNGSISYTFTKSDTSISVSDVLSTGTYYKWVSSPVGDAIPGANIVKINLA